MRLSRPGHLLGKFPWSLCRKSPSISEKFPLVHSANPRVFPRSSHSCTGRVCVSSSPLKTFGKCITYLMKHLIMVSSHLKSTCAFQIVFHIMKHIQHPSLCSTLKEFPFVLQAGELFEKVSKNERALEAYRKGHAYRRGSVLFIIQPE